MKIGFDAKRFFMNFTGLGNYSRTLIGNLVKYHPEHNFYLYTSQDNSAKIAQNISTDTHFSVKTPTSFMSKISSSFWRSFLLPDNLREDEVDLYHGLSHELPYKTHLKTDAKTVVSIHDLIFLKHPNLYSWSERQIYYRKFRYSCNISDRIVAVSLQTKEDIINYFGIPAAKVLTIYQSCDEIFYHPVTDEVKDQLKQKYNLPSDFVLYVGSLTKRKNILSLLQALNLIKTRLDCPVVLVGNGNSYKKKIVDFLHENNLSNQVSIISKVPTEDLPGLYQSASLFVYPSIYEGFGIPIIEALISKVPVITTKGGCFPEAGGPSTFYVDTKNVEELADAMERILSDRKLTADMIRDGYDYAGRFHAKTTSDQLNSLYNSLIY